MAHRWAVWVLVSLIASAGMVVGIDRAFFAGAHKIVWPPVRCVVHGVDARCGTFVVPENRAKPKGRTIGLRVVVLPAFSQPARTDAVTYLAGGPGDPATEQGIDQGWQSSALNVEHDILLVDQRGTGGSNTSGGDSTRYGTRMAMDDVDAVRAALGYTTLDVIGSSYGATAAQVLVTAHPSSVRTLILTGATAIDVPFFDRYAANSQHALDGLATLCRADEACRRAFPGWERQFGALVKAWNAQPVHGMTGDQFASVVHTMLLDLESAVSIPLVVTRAAAGDYGALDSEGSADLSIGKLGRMSSIWCNEPWVGLDATGPWGTDFDSYTTARIAAFRQACGSIPKRAEPRPLWTLPRASRVPVLAVAGGADPQDPPENLDGLKQHFPDSRVLVLPHIGHQFHIGGCFEPIMAAFVSRGTTKGLDLSACDGVVVVPPFPTD
ncbi:MAG TPA: alpha/beta fold hydrolase [Gaiellaceae bacterium]|jgi:pimeloyl-ACP methyl ester carboxylesterase|nr:alpha/beta fold hydrolase [Gaiellaceae bacterium]